MQFHAQYSTHGDKRRFRSDIEGLRALAVIPVVLFHAGFGILGGYIGVDIFFVISGYLITRVIDSDISTDNFSIIDFYDHRIRRIFPALLFMLAAASIAAYLILPPLDHQHFSDDLSSAAGFISNIHFYKQVSYFDISANTKPLLHTWSLAIEEQFYIFWPPVLWLLTRRPFNKWRVLIVAILIVVSLAISQVWLNANAAAAFYLLPSRAWELTIGALLGLTESRRFMARLPRVAAHIVSLAGLTAIIATAFTYNSWTPFPGLNALPPCLGAVAIIITGEAGPSLGGLALALPLLRWFGKISYSLYLWHWPILVFATLYLQRALTFSESAFAVAIACVFAWLSWKFVEQPFRTQRAETGIAKWRVAAGLMILAVFIALGIVGARTHGFAFRAPDIYRWSASVQAEDDGLKHSPCITYGASLTPVEPCLIGAPSDGKHYNAVLWGDSYATHIAPAFDQFGKKFGLTFRVMTKAGCWPIPNLVFTPMNEDRVACEPFNKLAIAEIAADKQVKLVVLSARWDVLATKEALGAPPGKNADPTTSLTEIERSLRQTLTRLSALQRTILLVGQIPVPPRNIPHCVSIARFLKRPDAPCLDMAAAWPREVDQDVSVMLKTSMAQEHQVYLIPVMDRFCGKQSCVTILDDRPIYMDETHLSPSANALVIPPLVEAYSTLLPLTGTH